MKEDNIKIYCLILLMILLAISIEKSLFILPLTVYCIYLGAYFRGKNWFLGWKRVIETGVKVKK